MITLISWYAIDTIYSPIAATLSIGEVDGFVMIISRPIFIPVCGSFIAWRVWLGVTCCAGGVKGSMIIGWLLW